VNRVIEMIEKYIADSVYDPTPTPWPQLLATEPEKTGCFC
jgi:hypothetical protein